MKISAMHKLDYYAGIPLCFVLGLYSKLGNVLFKRKTKIPQDPKKILLIKTWGLGNIVMLLPLLEKLKQAYPQAKIHFLTLRQNTEVLEENPWIDQIHLLDLSGYRPFWRSVRKIMQYLKRQKMDLVLDFDQFSRISPLLSFVAGWTRVGFNTKGQGRSFLLTHRVSYFNNKHMSRIFADIVKALGIDCDSVRPVSIPIKDKDKIAVRDILKENNVTNKHPKVILHIGVGVNAPIRRWEANRFAQVADKLIQEYGLTVFFTGVEAERDLIQETCKAMRKPAINLAGRLSIRELAYLVSRSNLVIANDTSLVHIASAMNTPVIGLYGPNTPLLYGPRQKKSVAIYKALPCSPCITNFNAKQTFCRNPLCMQEIGVEEVLFQAKELLTLNEKNN